MNIEVKGNSGCDIEIKDEGNSLYVYKTTNDDNYVKRLHLQGEKQRNALCTSQIMVPQVYVNEPKCIKMDYVYAKNFIDFFERSQFTEVDNFVNSIIEYINMEIEHCKLEAVDKMVFVSKMESIIKNCEKNPLVDTTDERIKHILDTSYKIFNDTEKIVLPVGTCHGDLTFSNIMFANSKYYLIDFLDSFVETPLQDIVKLRQDTQFNWSLNMYGKPYDTIRVRMLFKYIDDKIATYFSKYDFYNMYYNRLQLINMLRILPYAKSSTVVTYLINTLETILKEF